VDLFWLVFAWTAWCGLHSLLIHPPFESRLQARLGRHRSAYRLLYNLAAAISLLPVGLVFLQTDATPVLVWPWWLNPVKWFCWIAAAVLTWAGSRVYDTALFLGVRQWREGAANVPGPGLSASSGFVADGVLRFTRHPWYLAGLLLLWSRDLAVRDLVTSVLLTIYLLVGIHLEERKLLHRFGPAYRRYQRAVPMLWNPLRRHRQ
jgi:protein-S-isoprenylcysteine O-methyltransferase Ste14